MSSCCVIFYWLTIYHALLHTFLKWRFGLRERNFIRTDISRIGDRVPGEDGYCQINRGETDYQPRCSFAGTWDGWGKMTRTVIELGAFPTTKSKLHLLHVHKLIVCISLYKTNEFILPIYIWKELFNKLHQCIE